MSNVRLTPKDFVLHLAAMIALYWSVISLITLLFNYIDFLYPEDVLYYADPYSGAMRFAMASLIIVFPAFLILMRFVNRDLRAHTEKRDLGFRKWLLYVTILIGGVVIVGDLIALVNNFLGGELTMRFLLKVFTILIVVGAAFSYFLAELRGYWAQREKESRLVGLSTAALVILALVAGFVIMGSPGTQRELRLDQERVNDLQQIQWEVVNFWQRNNRLPQSIEQLESAITGFRLPEDPASGEPYSYRVLSDTRFELCATFAKETPERLQRVEPIAPRGTQQTSWQHGAGEECFERTVDPELIEQKSEIVPRPAPAR